MVKRLPGLGPDERIRYQTISSLQLANGCIGITSKNAVNRETEIALNQLHKIPSTTSTDSGPAFFTSRRSRGRNHNLRY